MFFNGNANISTRLAYFTVVSLDVGASRERSAEEYQDEATQGSRETFIENYASHE